MLWLYAFFSHPHYAANIYWLSLMNNDYSNTSYKQVTLDTDHSLTVIAQIHSILIGSTFTKKRKYSRGLKINLCICSSEIKIRHSVRHMLSDLHEYVYSDILLSRSCILETILTCWLSLCTLLKLYSSLIYKDSYQFFLY